VAYCFVDVKVRTVGRRDARRFLPSMLQRVDSKVGELCSLGMPQDAEHAAMIVEVIIFDLVQVVHSG
jgi:hypothetical protein